MIIARRQGSRVFPYTTLFRSRRSISYDAVEIPETGERLTQARFDALHASGKAVYVLIHMNPDSIVDVAATSTIESGFMWMRTYTALPDACSASNLACVRRSPVSGISTAS